jgi:two-component system cell cycle sensor histidine kinase/response regulator CckA
MVMGADGRIIRANAALGQLLSGAHVGQPAADTIGAVAEAAREAVWAELRPLLQGRAAVAKTFIARITISGGEQDVRVTALPLREPGQRVSGVLLRFADITAQRQLEAQLLHSQKLQATGQLAGGIAHDFNNLLTAMIGAVDGILERRETLNAAGLTETYEDAQQIRESAQRGAALVRQLLAFGRQQTLQPRVLAVNDVIADVSTLLRRLLCMWPAERLRASDALDHPFFAPVRCEHEVAAARAARPPLLFPRVDRDTIRGRFADELQALRAAPGPAAARSADGGSAASSARRSGP